METSSLWRGVWYVYWSQNTRREQRRCLELIKDYDPTIHYKPDQANVVIDALSRKVVVTTVATLSSELERRGNRSVEIQKTLESNILERIRQAHEQDRLLMQVARRVSEGRVAPFTINCAEAVRFQGRLCILQKAQAKEVILKKNHCTPYSSSWWDQDVSWSKANFLVEADASRCG